MRKIYLAFLIVVGFYLQSGNAQTVSSGGGKEVAKSNDPCHVASVTQKVDAAPGKDAAQKSDEPVKSGSDSQLDPATEQAIKETIADLSKQNKSFFEESIRQFIVQNLVRDQSITDTLSVFKESGASH